MSDLTTLTGLWLGTSRNGNKHMSGRLSPTARVWIFKNRNKDKDTDPDYWLCLGPVQTTDEGRASERCIEGLVAELAGE